MLLAIDIGNTNITLGLWDSKSWRLQWRLRTIHDRTVDEYGIYLKMLLREEHLVDAVSGIVLSSVVPPLTRLFIGVCERYLGHTPLVVGPDTVKSIKVLTEKPEEVGADRIVNAVAAYQQYPGWSIVIDMGTATTLDVVSQRGELLGVIIAPGIQVASEALTRRAAQLGDIALEAPPRVLGRNTVHAMQSGLVFGYTALIEGLVARLRTELKLEEHCVIGTGGLIGLITPHTDVIDYVEPWLTLTGLRLIASEAGVS